MFDAVTCAIPGAKHVEQVEQNVNAASLAPLDSKTMKGVQSVYERWVKPQIHANY